MHTHTYIYIYICVYKVFTPSGYDRPLPDDLPSPQRAGHLAKPPFLDHFPIHIYL